MKNQKTKCLALVLLLAVLSWTAAHAQIAPLGDSYINTADSSTNYGSKTTLNVDGASQISYIQFPLTSIPAGASISQATLVLYVNSVTIPGSFNVDYVNGAWAESTLDASNAPALGTTIASNVNVTTADKNQYILINVTSAVQAWLNGSETNNGIALVANSTFNATFDSKENTTTSHPAELDIAYGDGTITGVTTASGSGLTGGGTSGTLNLGLTTACTTNQVLQWNGSAWACTTVSGGGTITGVTAGTALTGGGTTGNVTLNLNTAQVPLLAASNTFTGNQTVNGNLSATGVVSGTGFQIGSNLFDYGSYANGNAFLGFAGNTTNTGSFNTAVGQQALYSNSTGSQNDAFGLFALYANTTGGSNTAVGSKVLENNTTGTGNTAIGAQALFYNGNGNGNTAVGFAALVSDTTDNNDSAFGYEALFNTNSVGAPNDAFGYQALYSNTTGGNSSAFGYYALYSNTNGVGNQAFGFQALFSNTTGYYNAAFGGNALYSNTIGYLNTAVGGSALSGNTTGSENTAVGHGACGTNTTSSDVTCLGYNANVVGGVSNATAIGAHARVEQSNSLVLGATGINVGIGTTKPSNILTVGRGAGHPVSDSWETYSSRRWKTNIQTLPDALSKVEQLRGVSYDLKDSGKHEIGVIAEEVGAVVPEVVSYEKNGKDAAGVDYSRLTALLIEAVKQQQQEISILRAQLRKRAAKEAKLESRVTQLEQDHGEAQLASAHPVR